MTSDQATINLKFSLLHFHLKFSMTCEEFIIFRGWSHRSYLLSYPAVENGSLTSWQCSYLTVGHNPAKKITQIYLNQSSEK